MMFVWWHLLIVCSGINPLQRVGLGCGQIPLVLQGCRYVVKVIVLALLLAGPATRRFHYCVSPTEATSPSAALRRSGHITRPTASVGLTQS